MTQTLYHVTPASNLPGIRRFGLYPTLGERAQQLDAEKSGVFLFTSTEAVENALNNWLGEAFEDCPDSLILLEIELPNDFLLEQDVEWEKISRRTLPPSTIKNIHLTEPGEPLYIAQLATSDSLICGHHSIVDGYPIISTHGEPLLIKRETLTIVAGVPLWV